MATRGRFPQTNATLTSSFIVRYVCEGDAARWAELRCRLWPEITATVLVDEAQAFAKGEKVPTVDCVLVADTGAEIAGFLELSIRPFADGCASHPVPHVEGWYVDPAARRRGMGRALMERAEQWAREAGFSELASDTTIDNAESLAVHARCGFEETERLVKLRKPL